MRLGDVVPGLGVRRLEAAGDVHRHRPDRDPCRPSGARHGRDPVTITAVPYFAWANRGAGPMRTWIPLD